MKITKCLFSRIVVYYFLGNVGDYSHAHQGVGNFCDSSLFRRFGNVAISPKWLGI